MPRTVRCSLIQATNAAAPDSPLAETKARMIEKHLGLIRQAAEAGAQIVCLQEIFAGPYFCAEQDTRWYDITERVPDGPTIRLMQDVARRHHIALIVPIYEREQEGIYYNTAAVIHNDGAYLGKYRKTHIPHVAPGFWEKFYFRPGNLGYPGLRPGLRQNRRLHLLRPPFPRRRPRARAERRGDRLQSLRHRRRPQRIPLETRTARACRGQRLLHRRHQPRRHRSALEHRRILRLQLLLRSPRADLRPGLAATKTKSSPPISTWT